jgi:hypothetical protein
MTECHPLGHNCIGAKRTRAIDDFLTHGVLAQVRTAYSNAGQFDVCSTRFGREPLDLAYGAMRRIRRIDKLLNAG